MSMDRMRTIESVEALNEHHLRLRWSDAIEAEIDLRVLGIHATGVQLGDWGHSIELGSGEEVGADRLWLETLTAMGHDDARYFLEWRMRNGLSLTKAADALGLARRTVAYYSNGDRPVPKAILLACTGWEVSQLRQAA